MPVHKLVITAGLMAANMLLTATKKIEGQRLDDLKFTGGDYGSPLPNIYGIRRQQLQVFWAEDLSEVKQQRKTKGGKFNEYTYFGTFALALAGHEISGLRRLWADKHLVLDLSGAGPITPFQFVTSEGKGSTSFAFNDHITVYLGTSTQDPDPRIQASTELLNGAGSCPAYRDTAYAAIKDMPLEKFGNRIPQCEGEISSVASVSYPYETFATEETNIARLWNSAFSSDYSRFMWTGPTGYEIWDVAARARMISGTLGQTVLLSDGAGLYNSGEFVLVSSTYAEVYRFDADGGGGVSIFTPASAAEYVSSVRVVADTAGTEHWIGLSYSSNNTFVLDGVVTNFATLTGVAYARVTGVFTDGDGSIWLCGSRAVVSGTTAIFYRLIGSGAGPGLVTVTGLPAAPGVLQAVAAVFYGGQFVFNWGTQGIYAADTAGTITYSLTSITLDVYNVDAQINLSPPNASTIWFGRHEVSLADLSVVRSVTLNNWVVSPAADGAIIHDPVNHALITTAAAGTDITWRYLDRLGVDGVTLGDIADNVCQRAGVTTYDFSTLDQEVLGWSWTQGQASNILSPLFDLHDSIIRPHDFTVQGIKLSGTSLGSIASEQVLPGYSIKVRQAGELPQAVTLNFADFNADQQPNAVRSSRPLDATDAVGEQSLDLTTLAISADDARGLADRMHRRIWNERTELQAGLTAQHLALEPGDCRTIELDGVSAIYRATSITASQGALQAEWVRDHPSLVTIDGAAGASFDGRDEAAIVVPLLSKGFVLDIPLISDLDESANPPAYLAAAPYAAGSWPGAAFYRSVDGEYSDEIASIASAAQATWGYTSSALPDANPNLWDRSSVIEVVLQTGTLTGTTEAAIDANASLNLALIGDEIVQFTTATLTGAMTYDVSGFKRGRRGTEWAVHASRETFLLLSTAVAEDIALSDVGTSLSFKAVTAGRTEAGAFPINLTPFTGASLKPYAPCQLTATLSGGDWIFTWVRRTRIGGAWTGVIPLGEASEEYTVYLGDGVTDVTKTVTSPTYTWTAAQQTTDTGSAVTAGELTFAVAQVSDSVGSGFVATY